ncbi:LPXTG cell wall anchor domain-containing protein [Georgenia sp. MJ173]|uniref:LPXTG cell wall anchor domain-containing protein n=1 Tax=Georgenia sunbinii TaxID=3117728 RepID=UPI002F269361
MIRRALAGMLAAALLVFAPSAAFGYAEDDLNISVSTTNPAPGESFTVAVAAPTGTDVTLTISADGVSDDAIQIAGTKSLTKIAVDNQAVFTVTLTEEATFQLVATDADGNVLDSTSIVVGDGGQAGPGAGDDGDDSAAGPSLPETGATATPLLIGAVLLLLVGATALVFNRRGKATKA